MCAAGVQGALMHRFRSLAKARQLPQGIGGVALISIPWGIAISDAMKLTCGSKLSSFSEAAKAVALLAFLCAWHTAFAASLRLDNSYRGLAVSPLFQSPG